jgi:Putative ATP-binding cassette
LERASVLVRHAQRASPKRARCAVSIFFRTTVKVTNTALELLILLRLRFRLMTRPKASAKRQAGFQGSRMVLQIVLVLGVGIALAFGLGNLLGDVVDGPSGRLLLPPMLAWISSSSALLLFLASVPVILAALTYNSDLRLLLLTPLSPRLVLGEKFIWLAANVAVPLLVVGMVVLLSIARAISLPVGYDLVAIPVLVVLPILPFSLAMLLTVLTLRWVPPARARTITSILSALLGIGAYLGTRALDSRSSGGGAQGLQSLFTGSAHTWWTALPTSWPGRALAAASENDYRTALLYLIGAALIAAAVATSAVLASAYVLATGWATYQEVGRKSAATSRRSSPRAANQADALADTGGARPARRIHPEIAAGDLAGILSREVYGNSERDPIWLMLLSKEWRSFRRDPQVWARFLYPLFIMGFGVYQGVAQSTAHHTGSVISVISAGLLTYVLILLLALPIVNREGRSLYLLGMAPVSARQIIAAKWIFCAAPVLAIVESILIVDAIVLKIDLGEALLIGSAFAGLVIALTGGTILISLIWPRLDWDNPSRQVSGAARVGGLLAGIALSGVVYALVVLALIWRTSRPLDSTLCAIGIYLLVTVVAVVAAIMTPRRLEALLRT